MEMRRLSLFLASIIETIQPLTEQLTLQLLNVNDNHGSDLPGM